MRFLPSCILQPHSDTISVEAMVQPDFLYPISDQQRFSAIVISDYGKSHKGVVTRSFHLRTWETERDGIHHQNELEGIFHNGNGIKSPPSSKVYISNHRI